MVITFYINGARSPNFLWVLILVLGSACSKPSAVAPIPTPEPTPAILASLETTRVKANGFSIIVPMSFKTGPWHGDDSSGWSFKGKEMTVSTESGMYAPDAKNYGYLNFRESQELIDGEVARIAAYVIPEQTGRIDPSKRNCVAAYFGTSESLRSELSISACFENPVDEQLAMQIIESIKFDRDAK